ncbi:MAG: Sensor protein SrrB [bacterium ADurb.Bin429]|nr:MAG: Sensor protein SrrB [bacterium ADurb.Bin429]
MITPDEPGSHTRGMPLRRRLLISSLLGAVPLILLGAILLVIYYRDARENVLDQNLALARVGATYVRGWVEGNLRTLHTLAGANETVTGSIAEKQTLVERQLRLQEDWESLFIVGPRGEVIATTDRQLIGGNVAERPYFSQSRQTNAPVVTNLLASLGTGNPVVIFSYPIMREGRFAGVVGAVVPSRELTVSFQQLDLPDETIIALLGSDHRLIARTDTPESRIGEQVYGSEDPFIFSGRAGRIVATSPFTGERMLVGYMPVRGTPWTLVIATPLVMVLAPVSRTLALFLALTFIVLVLTIIWSLYSAGYLSRQIAGLAAGAREIGLGNFQTRVQGHGGPELEQLAQSINMMAANLAVIDRLKADLLSMVSHELKTPLTTIRGTLEMLTAGVISPDDPRTVDLLRMAERQALRLQDQIENLLSAAREEAGALEVAPRAVPVSAIVQAAVVQFADPARERGLALTVEMPEELRVRAEAPKVALALNNLIDNAIKFTETGGITVRVTRDDGQAIIAVTDTGMGLTPEVRSHLFERFYQAESLLTRRAGGSGLGLYIVRAVAEAHGGRAFAESAGPGKGSTFGFTLPLAE